MQKTQLTAQEKQWISEKRIRRLTDNEEVLIYPMGAERYLASHLCGDMQGELPIQDYLIGKKVLVIPGYGNSSFLFALSGASEVSVYDKDPVTIAWVKAMKKYYHYREYSSKGYAYPSIGEILNALTAWYPPLLRLPASRLKHGLLWALRPKALRRHYIWYMLDLLGRAIQTSGKDYELDKAMQFRVGEIDDVAQAKPALQFDTVFVPYLLGVKNGIEGAYGIATFIKKVALLAPGGHLLVSPSHKAREYPVGGSPYLVLEGHQDIHTIPGLEAYTVKSYDKWFRSQGLVVFGF
jgi:hypothetical protein